jgi:hypothetical protein
MELSRSGDITQYIDRVRIIARQDIALTEVLTSEFSACDMENKELKVVLSNHTDPVLDYTVTPIVVTLEVKETGQTFTQTLTSGVLGSFASDTITLETGFDFSKGTYTFKAYFSSVLDVNKQNDTLVTSVIVNPSIAIQLNQISTTNACLAGELDIFQTVTIYNIGNMDLSNIALILQIDTGETGSPAYTILKEICMDTVFVNGNITYTFKNAYKVPWVIDYYPRITAYLPCDSTLIDTVTAIRECVDMKDLYMVGIDNPSTAKDKIGDVMHVTATIQNRSNYDNFPSIPISILVKNSQGEQIANFTETTEAIGISATISHTFTNSYSVPDDNVYYLTVYIDSYENYPHNDTVSITRYTDKVGITTRETSNVFSLSQNIPNPANNSTRIDYSVPEAGEVIFHVHSINGQLLYSKTIEASRGTNSIELNTSTFAAGVYFYSMEYKGQRRVKQLIINN